MPMATMRILQRGRMDPEHIRKYYTRTSTWFLSNISFCDKRSTSACFDRNMWLARDAIVSYGKAIDPKAQATAVPQEVERAVGHINFLLEQGLDEDQSIPYQYTEMVPPSLNRTLLADMKSVLMGVYWKTAADTTDTDMYLERGNKLLLAHDATKNNNSLLPTSWSTSRKTEALYALARSAHSAYESGNIDECKKAHELALLTCRSIGLGLHNYSDVKKADAAQLRSGIESDMVKVFSISAHDIPKIINEDAVMSRISDENNHQQPKWRDSRSDYS